jgi:hypothetical protein
MSIQPALRLLIFGGGPCHHLSQAARLLQIEGPWLLAVGSIYYIDELRLGEIEMAFWDEARYKCHVKQGIRRVDDTGGVHVRSAK